MMHMKEKGYHHGNLRQALLDVTKTIIEEEGIQSLSLREAARRADVSRTAPYRHFEDKEALLAAVAEEGFRLVADDMRVVLQRSGDKPIVAIQELAVVYVKFMVRNKAYYPLMFGPNITEPERHESMIEAKREVIDILLDVVKGCREKKGDSPQDVDVMGIAAWGLMHGLSDLIYGKLIPEDIYSDNKLEYFSRQGALTFIRGLAN